ncbi:hypothetical protein [Bacillus sp. MRMR6]|uniref:hypothetical protein n=1 Tax=Bacillus sp. MRMR6 TaxID=1928617 RepID=UPI000952F0E4|nr:hypothetical protein [Bacillus sp. MRMR6]OLS36884.1 hypothetical protein BTR25_16975 [Bacillus sp. MRMR6]
MQGIYFVNDRISLNSFSKEESLLLQEQNILEHFHNHNIHIVKLNPYQLNEYYTIPHALLYDLKQEKAQFDYFIYYSPQVMEDFIYSYPARWLMLKSYFNEIITIEERTDLIVKKVV